MLTQNDLKAIGQIVIDIIKPLKQDLVFTKNKISTIENKLTGLDSKVTGLEKNVKNVAIQIVNIQKKLDYLTGKIDLTHYLIEVAEDNHEKRLKRIEKKLDLPPIGSN